jgi:hypothetical protein
MVLGLLKNSTSTPMIGNWLLDETIGGPFGPLPFRGRNKKYHTRNKAMAKPCKIMVGCFVLVVVSITRTVDGVETKRLGKE